MVSRPFSLHRAAADFEKEALDRLIYRNCDVIEAGKNLLGKRLFTNIGGLLTGGIIIETESYAGVEDKASHAYGGRRTERTETMYKAGGVAYVYLCYGIHCLLNVVTGDEGVPHAVLIRAIRPTHGIDTMMLRRKKIRLDATLAGGPGSLTKALGIDLSHNGLVLGASSIWIEEGIQISRFEATKRIGVEYAGKCANLPYRFIAK